MSENAARRQITITRIFDAPRDMVFKAWTEAERIAEWWGPEDFSAPKVESDPRPGGTLSIVMRGPDGLEYPMTGIYKEVEPPERLVLETAALGPDGERLLEAVQTVTFAERDGKTELTVQADAVALVAPAVAMLGGMLAGWNQSLQCLDDVLTGAAGRQIVVSRMFEAPREQVFAAWTERPHLEKWWAPEGLTMTTDEIDIRPGGMWRWTLSGPDGSGGYPNVIVFDEITAPEPLVYTYGPPEDPGQQVRTVVTFDDLMGIRRSPCGSCSPAPRIATRRHSTGPSRAPNKRSIASAITSHPRRARARRQATRSRARAAARSQRRTGSARPGTCVRRRRRRTRDRGPRERRSPDRVREPRPS